MAGSGLPTLLDVGEELLGDTQSVSQLTPFQAHMA
jgi:hypothetical protein